MKNKGFAVSAALYGMVTIFVIVMFALLGMFKDYRAMNKDYINKIKEDLNSPAIENKEKLIKEELTLDWYPYLFKITVTIKNPDQNAVKAHIKLSVPNEIAISSSAYTGNGIENPIKIKSCDSNFNFGSSSELSVCEGAGGEYTIETEPVVSLQRKVYTDPINEIPENVNAIYYENSEYFHIKEVNLEPGDNVLVFYLRTTTTNKNFYDNIKTENLITLYK